MAFSKATVEAILLQSKTAKVDVNGIAYNFPKLKLEVSKEFKDNVESMGTILNDGDDRYWVFESQLIELIVKK